MDHLRILLADPDEQSRGEMLHWLREAGHEVVTARSGNEAMSLIKKHAFDAVVTEVLLPERDGLEIIKCCRQLPRIPRLIAISGGGSYLSRLDCLKLAKMLGAHAVALKPLSLHQLMTALHGTRPAAAPAYAVPTRSESTPARP